MEKMVASEGVSSDLPDSSPAMAELVGYPHASTPNAEVEARLDGNIAYTREEFDSYYGPLAEEKWEKAISLPRTKCEALFEDGKFYPAKYTRRRPDINFVSKWVRRNRKRFRRNLRVLFEQRLFENYKEILIMKDNEIRPTQPSFSRSTERRAMASSDLTYRCIEGEKGDESMFPLIARNQHKRDSPSPLLALLRRRRGKDYSYPSGRRSGGTKNERGGGGGNTKDRDSSEEYGEGVGSDRNVHKEEGKCKKRAIEGDEKLEHEGRGGEKVLERKILTEDPASNKAGREVLDGEILDEGEKEVLDGEILDEDTAVFDGEILDEGEEKVLDGEILDEDAANEMISKVCDISSVLERLLLFSDSVKEMKRRMQALEAENSHLKNRVEILEKSFADEVG
eukprot:jgi/Bigna1/78894/fgenesh1_pg.58_\